VPEGAEFGKGKSDGTSFAVRLDSGVREGDAISPFYDPMIAKLIVWGQDRNAALARMTQALSDYQIVGLATNVAFLKRLIASAPFANADLDTGLIERHHDALFPPLAAPSIQDLALAAAFLLTAESAAADNDPWSDTGGWRMNATLQRPIVFADETGSHALKIAYRSVGWAIGYDGADLTLHVTGRDAESISIRLGEQTVRGSVVRDSESFHVFRAGGHVALTHVDPMAHAGAAETEGGRLTAPMPGKIVAVLVAAGASVEKGTPLLVMEAMKMEHTIVAPASGVVDELLYAVGDQVAEGAQLLSLKSA
jgi:3-methylcrotonyl-CoA carboxylase alpha subunit